ncbi:MAG: cadherin-like beta sandwich domain-containing protein [Treponema sp.]|nr:cadherin-like beta sandwich domain-containing protein [Treponema sp.]
MKAIQTILATGLLLLATGCSALFENIYNADGSEKTGNSSLTSADSSSSLRSKNITSGLVVIKASEPEYNQITYDKDQTAYYVGMVPKDYEDSEFDEIGYTNGTDVPLLAKDDPVEFRCYAQDSNATVTWTAVQTWNYVPEVKMHTTTDKDGNEVTYSSVISQTALPLSENVSVRTAAASGCTDGSRIYADIPYGVTVLTCTITADDEQYTSTYRVVVTKVFISTIADSSTEEGNTVTDHGLVVIKATQPGYNAINYSSTQFEYEIGDSSGLDTTGDLTGRDDPVTFKCFLLDEEATLTWSARQTKRYVPVTNDTGGVISQELETLSESVSFDILGANDSATSNTPFLRYDDSSTETASIVTSNLPYGTTEVYATITAQNKNIDGDLVTDTTQYKITLTKRYVITAAAGTDSTSNESGLAVYANGKTGNLIDYDAQKTSYAVTELHGGNDPVTIRFVQEEPEFTTLTWTAVQTQTYTAHLTTYTSASGTVTYTYQTGGTYTDLDEQVDLLDSGTLALSEDGTASICTGNLPYGTTVVTVTSASDADSGAASTYTITLKKKQVVTNVNIVSSDEENSNISLITDRGLVVLSAQNPDVNQISFSADSNDYTVTGITGADNDMGFRCFLADTDASITWSIVQTKAFSAIVEETETTETDSLLGTTTTVTTKTVTGQTEEDCAEVIEYTVDDTYSDNQAITATIPYGVTVVTATVSADGEADTVYTITLTRDIAATSSSSSSTEAAYSQLSELTVDINGDDTTSAVLTPSFSPAVTTYTLTADEDADSITINATPASEDAEVSTPVSITKYGTVPNVSGSTVPLVGGTSRITFTVTDESGVSRTYTIYVIKTNDGDTSLASLETTPSDSFANGVSGFTTDTSYTGESAAGTAKYAMTLSADSRVDVTQVEFTAVPNNKRTTVAYGVSDSVDTLPGDDAWTSEYSYATQTGSTPGTYTVQTGDVTAKTLEKVLWVRTTSDSYYHTSTTTTSGYEETKRADVTYHAVDITKAGDENQNLTALVVVATYEDGTTETVLDQRTSSTVAYTTTAASTKVTTYADKLDFYFRPLDKDAAITYMAVNSAYDGSDENKTFTGYANSATSVEPVTDECSYLDDGAAPYYHFTLGEVVKGTGVDAQTADLPNGTTKVTICGISYTFVKPNLTDTSYTVSGWTGNGTGIDTTTRTSYIYVENRVESVVLSLQVAQQNAKVRIESVEQTADANSTSVTNASNASYAVLHEDATDEIISNKWKVSIGNATYSADGYTRTQPETVEESSTILPVGTTKVLLYVDNNGTSKDYTYYIVRADDSEARLKSLKLTAPKTTLLQDASGFDWTSTADSNTYIADSAGTAYTLDKGTITLKATAVSEKATISVTKRHSATSKITTATDTSWDDETAIGSNSTGAFSGTYTITDDDAGSLLFTITVTSASGTEHVYYLIAYVEADTTATLTALKIVQNGTTDEFTNTLLADSFDSETLSYTVGASLSFTGNIVVTPTVYEKATISDATLTLLSDSIDDTDSDTLLLSLDGSTDTGTGAKFTEEAVLTIPASYYQKKLGRTVRVSYSVQAQDTTVSPVTYTADIALPTLTTITETSTFTTSTEYEYVIPSPKQDTMVAYRFGSVIADESTFLGETKSYFGGIDIIGTSSGTGSSPAWYASSFAQSGFQLAVNVDGTDYWVTLDETGKSTAFYTVDFSTRTVGEATDPGITLEVKPAFQYEGDTPYLALTFNLTNPSGKAVKLGASIDTLVGTIEESTNGQNDRVTVVETDNGFTMNGSDYTFTVCLKNAYGVDNVDRIWYGAYDSASFTHMNVFTNENGSLASGEDSAASFSWDLGSETSYTKTIRINMSAK